ncbi:META domain-containing protein [Paraburkholderia sp. DHOC27]|uniref:META domain-containing protein n=1 Tax=Paraburkholderia sp. DHOC27 TaxID=2303330 RepID=UPI000E3D0280|nr:META domain-containing protein [Paraburkholderia sp. DHOC27]RFU46202.1 META domain-containing protein [Paraburkholderia sp. DHOC27]
MFTTSPARSIARLVAPLHASLVRSPRAARRVCGHALAALSVAALFTACSMPTHPDAKAPPPDPFNPAATQLLDDTSWTLSTWKQADGSMRAVPAADSGAPLTLVLSTASGQRRVNGFSGCNRFMGTYALTEGKLSFGPLAGTRMACATPGGELEGPYLDALAHINRTGVQMRPPQELQLILENGDTLTFARQGK